MVKLKYLDETSRKELNAPLEELAREEETVLDENGLAEAEQKYQELRTRIEALGPAPGRRRKRDRRAIPYLRSRGLASERRRKGG